MNNFMPINLKTQMKRMFTELFKPPKLTQDENRIFLSTKETEFIV